MHSGIARFALFETAVGWCAIAWGPDGITALHLPGRTKAATTAGLRRRVRDAVEAAPSREIARVTDAIAALTAGRPIGLEDVQLDMSDVPPFHQRVYEATRRLGPGDVATYGDIARTIGSPGSARAVGQALGRNPFAIIVPCHRVIAAGDRLGGFSAPGGVTTKRRLLEIEGGLPRRLEFAR